MKAVSVAFMLSPLWMLLTEGLAKGIRFLEIAVEAAWSCRQALSKRKVCQAGSAHGVSKKSCLLSSCCVMRRMWACRQGASRAQAFPTRLSIGGSTPADERGPSAFCVKKTG
jgi:hypothetical protein